MCYDLTVNRLGVFVELTPAAREKLRPRSGRSYVMLFSELANLLHSRLDLGRLLASETPGATLRVVRQDDSAPEIMRDFADTSGKLGGVSKIVARLPFTDFDLFQAEDSKVAWNLRVRTSFTGCALEEATGLTKLWASFELVAPRSIANRDIANAEDRIATLVGITTALSAIVLDKLEAEYAAAIVDLLPELHGVDQPLRRLAAKLQVTMTDNEHQKIAALMDALTLDGLKVSDIRTTEHPMVKLPKAGLEEFERFASSMGHKKADTILSRDLPNVTGLISRRNHTIFGFALRHGMIRGKNIMGKPDPDQIRMKSGARLLSALLASKEAEKHEVALRASNPPGNER